MQIICGIYKITNKINGKVYIGQSINIYKRWQAHKQRSNYPNSTNYNQAISRAFRKYGVDNFSFEILEECDQGLLDEKEEYYIELYEAIGEKGYNLDKGGAKKAKESENYIPHPKQIIRKQKEEKIKRAKITNKEKFDKIKEKDPYRYYRQKQKIITISQEIKNGMSLGDIQSSFNASIEMIDKINEGQYDFLLKSYFYTYPLRENNCPICGKKLVSLFSIRCANCRKEEEYKINRIPTKQELKKLIRELSFIQIGEKFGVSDNAIRKWCEKYGLPTQSTEIMFYTDKEWDEENFNVIPYIPFKREQRINELIEEYKKGSSLSILSKKYNLSSATIKEAFKQKQVDISQTTQESLPVYKIDPVSLIILEEFPSIASTKDLGDVSACIHGRRKTSGGYKWIFKKNASDYNIGDILPEELLPIYIR